MHNNRLTVIRDEKEDLIEQQKIDSLIFKFFLAMIVIIPLLVSAGIHLFNSPIIENDSTFTSGYKGDVFSLHKSIVAIILTILIVLLFTYKVIILNYQVKRRTIHLFLLATCLFILLSTVFSPYKTIALFGLPSRNDGAIMYLCYITLFFISLEIKYPIKVLQYLAYAFIPFIIINFTLSTMSFFGRDPLTYDFVKKLTTMFLPDGAQLSQGSQLLGTLNHGNYISGSFSVMAILFLALSIGENRLVKRILYLFLSIISTAIILMSLASSGFVTLIFMMLFILLLVIRSSNLVKSLVVTTGYVVAFASMIFFFSNHNALVWKESVGLFMSTNPFEISEASTESLKEILLGSEVEAAEKTEFQLPELPESGAGPGSGRLFIWDRILKLVMERPITGYGFDTLSFFFPQNDLEKHAQIETYTVTVDKPHSMYIGMLYSTGLFGFISFIGLIILSIIYTVKWLFRSKRMSKSSPYLSAFILAWGAYLFQSVFNDTLVGTSIHMWIVGGIVTIYTIRCREEIA